MVRVKHRYLLVHILYPTPPPPSSAAAVPALISFRRPAPPHLASQHLLRALRDQISLLYGDYGAGVTKASLAIKYFSPATSTLVVRCARGHERLVRAALTLTTHLPPPGAPGGGRGGFRGRGRGGRSERGGRGGYGASHAEGPQGQGQGEPCVMRVVRVSGTIRKVEEEAIRRAREDIIRARKEGRAAEFEGKEAGDLLEDLLGPGEGEDQAMVEDEDGEDDGDSEDD